MKRGGVYWVNLEPASPPEFGKVRPALIISNTIQNIHLSSVVMIPFSTKAPEIWPLRLEFKLENKKSSYLVIPGIRQVHKKRLKNKITELTSKELAEIDEALKAYLSD